MNTLSRLLLALVAVLVLSAGIWYITGNAGMTQVTFTYQRATEREDGTPLPLEEIKYTRLFCDGVQVAEEAGADGDISARLKEGYHDCYATHVDTSKMESRPSSTTKKYVEL